MPSPTLAPERAATKAEPMRRRSDFDAVIRRARARHHRLLTLRLLPNGLERVRYGFAIGRHVGGAVQRNRVRRRLRSIARELTPNGGFDMLVTAKPTIVQASYQEVRDVIGRSVALDRSHAGGKA